MCTHVGEEDDDARVAPRRVAIGLGGVEGIGELPPDHPGVGERVVPLHVAARAAGTPAHHHAPIPACADRQREA